MSNIHNHKVNMKRKMTAMFAGTMLAITGATLPASAIVANTNSQHLTVARNNPQRLVNPSTLQRPEGMTVARDTRGRTGRYAPRR